MLGGEGASEDQWVSEVVQFPTHQNVLLLIQIPGST